MNSRKAGQAKIGVVVLIIAAVIAVLYFTSDVFKTKINVAADQYAHWTPENIAKDPENYLNFCEQQAKAAVQKLKASQIAVAQNRANLEAMHGEAAEKITLGNKALQELKTVYKDASAANSWPATWQGAPRDQDWVKRQIVSFSRQIVSQESLKAKTEAGIKQLDVQATKIQEANSQAQEQIGEIKTSRETLKVQKITSDLSQQLSNIGATLRATISTASESTGTITLDQLKADSATTVDEAEFSKIMGM
ncbi:MAG: hypothetical protein K8T26_10275 [Lentisphaerae bacterium]|nr:hypothetical protein [Lentisphaerota bacterium]